MLYKELRGAWKKYLPVLLVYLLAGLVISTLLSPFNMFYTGKSIFHNWVIATIVITIGAAILGGAATISEEIGQNTVSFLLTRPINRKTVYAVKLLVNAVILTAILGTTNLVMFLVEQLPQSLYSDYWVFEDGILKKIDSYSKMPAGEALVDLVSIFSLGMVFLALTALVSIFTQSTMQTIVSTLLVLIIPFGIIVLITGVFNSNFISQTYVSFLQLGLTGSMVLLALAFSLFLVGLRIFKSKEF